MFQIHGGEDFRGEWYNNRCACIGMAFTSHTIEFSFDTHYLEKETERSISKAADARHDLVYRMTQYKSYSIRIYMLYMYNSFN